MQQKQCCPPQAKQCCSLPVHWRVNEAVFKQLLQKAALKPLANRWLVRRLRLCSRIIWPRLLMLTYTTPQALCMVIIRCQGHNGQAVRQWRLSQVRWLRARLGIPSLASQGWTSPRQLIMRWWSSSSQRPHSAWDQCRVTIDASPQWSSSLQNNRQALPNRKKALEKRQLLAAAFGPLLWSLLS